MLKLLYFNFEDINILFSVEKGLIVPSHESFDDSFLPAKDSVFQSKYITEFAAQMQQNAEVGAALFFGTEVNCYRKGARKEISKPSKGQNVL